MPHVCVCMCVFIIASILIFDSLHTRLSLATLVKTKVLTRPFGGMENLAMMRLYNIKSPPLLQKKKTKKKNLAVDSACVDTAVLIFTFQRYMCNYETRVPLVWRAQRREKVGNLKY